MAERTKGSRFVVTRRMITTKSVAKKIDHQMDVANRLYNLGVKHYAAIVNTLLSDPDFDSLLREYHKWFKENKGSEKENPYTKTISLWLKTRELNEYNLHAWFGATAKKTFPKCLNSMIVQKLASNLYAAIKKVIFSSGKEIHFRKYGQTCTLEGKNNSTGIVYKEETDFVVFAGLKIPLKEIRDNDKYLQTAMAYGKVKYCRIIRKPFKTRYRYFLQIVMEGVPPDKIKVDPEKRGVVGQDPGISNSTFCGKTYAGFETLSKGIEKYTKEVREAAIKYSCRRRMANPQNYEENGTIKTGVKLEWNHTKGMQEALFELKNAYRKASEHTKNYNGWLSNRIVEKTSILKQESMDYKALAKRSTKPAKRKPKPSVIKTKSGKTKTVYKFKTKKRFGGSILKRSPGAFDKMLRDKTERYGGKVIILDPRKTASSQMDHVTGKKTKHDLSERSKIVGGHRVQRDFYSSFLNEHTNSDNELDVEGSKRDFKRFLKQQGKLVRFVLQNGDKTKNFGLADFVKQG